MDSECTIEDQLCARIEELEMEKVELNERLDAAQQEAAKARLAQSTLKETFTAEIQKAVKQARRDWASHASDEIKALWQAEVLEEAGRYIRCAEDAALLRSNAQELRRQAEGDGS